MRRRASVVAGVLTLSVWAAVAGAQSAAGTDNGVKGLSLRLVPGVQVARIDSNKWAVSVRGFNSRYANKLLVLGRQRRSA